jgi:UDP-glucose 4-epimerase
MNDRAVGEVFNVGSDVETSILQLAETMIRIAGSRSKVVFVPQQSVYGESYEDVPRRVPCVRRMHEILGVRAETPLEKGLHQTIEWFREGNGR